MRDSVRHAMSAGFCHSRRYLAVWPAFVTSISLSLCFLLAFEGTSSSEEPAPLPVVAAQPSDSVGGPRRDLKAYAASTNDDQPPNPEYEPVRGPVYSLVIGQEVTHRIEPGDTLAALGRRYNVSVRIAQRQNGIADPRRLRIGQTILLSNRHIVPAPFPEGLVVDLELLRLFVLRAGAVQEVYPIAAGRPAWETPAGIYRIVGRRKDPTWYVPPSIQREMQALGQPVRRKVPPGPENPLGPFWLQLSAPGIGIHGTNAPWSVGRYATHGCIRLHNEHVERLFHDVPDGTAVAIASEPVRLAQTIDGRVFLEVHDRPGVWSEAKLRKQLESHGLWERVAWERARAVLVGRWGVAVEISKPSPSPAL